MRSFLDVPVARHRGNDIVAGQLILHPQLAGLRDVLRRARAIQALGVHRGRQCPLDRRHEGLRAAAVKRILSAAAVPSQVTAAAGQQALERGDRGPYRLGPDLGFRDPPFHRPATPVSVPGLLLPAFRGFSPLPLAALGRRQAFPLPLLLGSQPFRLGCLLLPGMFGLLLLLEPGLGRAVGFPPLLRGLLFQLGRDPALFCGPGPGSLFFQLLLLQLGLLAGLIHLGEQRLASGHRVLQAGRSTSRARQTEIRIPLNVTDQPASTNSPYAARTCFPY